MTVKLGAARAKRKRKNVENLTHRRDRQHSNLNHLRVSIDGADKKKTAEVREKTTPHFTLARILYPYITRWAVILKVAVLDVGSANDYSQSQYAVVMLLCMDTTVRRTSVGII